MLQDGWRTKDAFAGWEMCTALLVLTTSKRCIFAEAQRFASDV